MRRAARPSLILIALSPNHNADFDGGATGRPSAQTMDSVPRFGRNSPSDLGTLGPSHQGALDYLTVKFTVYEAIFWLSWSSTVSLSVCGPSEICCGIANS